MTTGNVAMPSLAERQARLFEYVTMDRPRSQALMAHVDELLTDALQKESQEIGCLETFVENLPVGGKYIGTYITLCVNEMDVTACRVDLANGAVTAGSAVPVAYTDPTSGEALQLYDERNTASIFMNTAIEAVQALLQRDGDLSPSGAFFDIVLTSAFPLQMGDAQSAVFLNFHELCPNLSEDPIEGTDIASLLNLGFERVGINARVTGLISAPVALLLTGEYDRPFRSARCLLAAVVDLDVGLAFVAPETLRDGLHSHILDVDLSGYKGIKTGKPEQNYTTQYILPRCAVDFEIDFTHFFGRSEYRKFERMVGARHMPELCRRYIVACFQGTCPQSVWTPNSLSLEWVMRLLKDGDGDPMVPVRACEKLWDWKITAEQGALICKCVSLMVRRSAAALAGVLAALAKRTGRLQPALGGCSVALHGCLGANAIYQQMLRQQLDVVFQKDTQRLITFLTISNSPSARGAGILGALRSSSSN